MPNLIVGFVAIMFYSVGAFAEIVGGSGECRGAFILFDYYDKIYNDTCEDDINVCADAAAQFATSGTTEYNTYKTECDNFYNSMNGDVWEFCELRAMSNTNYYDALQTIGLEDICNNVTRMPYHLKFGEPELPDMYNVYYDAVDALYSANLIDEISCYNDPDDRMRVTVCDCGEYGADYESNYGPCPAFSFYDDVQYRPCYLGGYEGYSLLCVSRDDLNDADHCGSDICDCGYDREKVYESGWVSGSNNGSLHSTTHELIDLWQWGDETSNWGDYYNGCAVEVHESWACNSGYYYNADNNCSTCPVHESGKQTSSYANNSGSSACYIPAGTYTDASGTYEYTEDCTYN